MALSKFRKYIYRSDLDVRGGRLSTNRYIQGCIARYINAAPAPGTGPANLVDDTIGCQWTTGIGDGRYDHIHPLTLRQRNQNSSPFSIILGQSLILFVGTYTTTTALTHPRQRRAAGHDSPCRVRERVGLIQLYRHQRWVAPERQQDVPGAPVDRALFACSLHRAPVGVLAALGQHNRPQGPRSPMGRQRVRALVGEGRRTESRAPRRPACAQAP
jgi:hypothetical protein